MAEKTWIDQLSRLVLPIAVVAIGGYGMWDLLLKPWLKDDSLTTQACNLSITGVFIELPGKAGQPAKQTRAPEGNLPLVVPAGEKRPISIQVDSPEEKGVVYTWKANYGQFDSRVTTDNQSVYMAPPALVNDIVTIEVRVQGCTAIKRTVAIAVVPSALTPTQPLTAPLPAQPPPGQPLPNQPLPTDPFATPTPESSPGIAPLNR